MTQQNSAGLNLGDPNTKPIDIVLGDELRAIDDEDTFLDEDWWEDGDTDDEWEEEDDDE